MPEPQLGRRVYLCLRYHTREIALFHSRVPVITAGWFFLRFYIPTTASQLSSYTNDRFPFCISLSWIIFEPALLHPASSIIFRTFLSNSILLSRCVPASHTTSRFLHNHLGDIDYPVAYV